MSEIDLWFTEKQTDNMALSLRLKTALHREQTKYQDLLLVDTYQFGRMLVLDGCIMTTEVDEFVYHEMMAHVPLFTHPNPRRVLVVGGGDGGVIREVLKHPTVEEAILAEIDERVIAVCKEYLPSISHALDDPRCKIMIGDGIEFVQKHKNAFDVIIVDSTDPIGPAVGLYAKAFYRSVYEALTEDGLFVAQTESPFVNPQFIRDVQRRVGEVFPITTLYWAAVPTYPTGFWSITLGSKKHDPRTVDVRTRFEKLNLETKYYDPEYHRMAFHLPRFARNLTWDAQKAAMEKGIDLPVGLPGMGPEKTAGALDGTADKEEKA